MTNTPSPAAETPANPDSPRRVGVMGGTFDPIHNGHLVAASEVADRFDLDVVVFVPTGQPWQKKGKRVSPAEDRYLMTVIATAANPSFRVSRWISTVGEHLHRRHADRYAQDLPGRGTVLHHRRGRAE
ncbi:adenylyltransferase/cytidyltransferase family protein [Corynebacterium urealyticum]|uniref:nicotinate-nicotinamide nucleotide adenylyltransferase n=1 Tax=Corynebacterium urealyticum TaxID=43771 RepID=UPI00293EF997|nr:adenylyltransferase/cytidyltransferase family protein [Corynebacterium urealyticum]WOH93915.1 adenylyltransferase/cytidyltransferase family protein [Corynebacterium urealyticum]